MEQRNTNKKHQCAMNLKQGMKEYEKATPDESIKALAKIKVILDTFQKLGYHIDYELEEVIDEIEAVLDEKSNHIETFKSDKRLGTIKKLIIDNFEKMGRMGDSSDGNEMSILIGRLNKYLEGIIIPNNYMAIAKLKYERQEKW